MPVLRAHWCLQTHAETHTSSFPTSSSLSRTDTHYPAVPLSPMWLMTFALCLHQLYCCEGWMPGSPMGHRHTPRGHSLHHTTHSAHSNYYRKGSALGEYLRVCAPVCVWDSVISSGACTPEWVHLFKSTSVFYYFIVCAFSILPRRLMPCQCKGGENNCQEARIKIWCIAKTGSFPFHIPSATVKAFTHSLICCQIKRFFPFFSIHGFAIELCRAHCQHLPVGQE